MKVWQSNILGIACIGGAALGITLISTLLVRSQRSATEIGFLLFFASLCVWGIWCGVLAIRQEEQFLRHHLVLWFIQIPVFSTSLISYTFGIGALLIMDFRLDPIGCGWLFLFGSKVEFSWFSPERPIFGINLVALAIWLFVWRQYKKTLPLPAAAAALASPEV